MATPTADEILPRSMRKSFSVRRLAEFLDVSDKTIWRLIERRKINAVRIGRRAVRILPLELKRFLATIADVPGARQTEGKALFDDTTCSAAPGTHREATEGPSGAAR